MNEWKRLFEIGILKEDYIRVMVATGEPERLSAERSVANCNPGLSTADRKLARSLASLEVDIRSRR